MNRQAVFTLVIASLMTAGLSGCQTASRWAWWKDRGDGASTVAQSTAPQLPSEGATPQAVEVPGLEPTSSPSAANLAAAQSLDDASSASLPATSAATFANAPIANYPVNATSSTDPPAGSSPTASQFSAPAAAIASVPPSGPYDPNGYKPSEPLAVARSTSFESDSGNPLRASSATVDRYAIPTANTQTPQMDPTYAATGTASVASSTAATVAPADRYALPTVAAAVPAASDTNSTAAALPTQSSPEAAFASSTTSAVPPTDPITNASDAAPTATATVQLSTPAGKYRPGGTSDYAPAIASQHIEVASRPAATQSMSSSAGVGEPLSPPASTPTSSGAIGTY